MFHLSKTKTVTLILSFILLATTVVFAQTTTFTYQGRFTDTTVTQPTNGAYEMQFKAFDGVANGNQFGATITLPTVQVTNGVFAVPLDFGAATFQGADVYLEIGVRPAASAVPFTLLNPRQRFTSAPYAIKSLNATNAVTANDAANLGGKAANQYVQTTDARLTDARTPAAGSTSYIQNATAAQATANFNISGGGTLGGTLSANLVNSVTNYRIGGTTVFSTPNTTSVVAGQLSNHSVTSGNNAFFGYKAGAAANGFSQANTFIGSDAGELTTSGGNNSFVGRDAGFFNSSGSLNSFFGSGAGQANTTANANSFFGYFAGHVNSTGTRNSFFGFQAGQASATVSDNSFFGYQAGSATTGADNAFFGSSTGLANSTGSQNTFVGTSAGSTTTTGSDNTLIGYVAKTSGNENVAVGASADANGSKNTQVGNRSASQGSNNTLVGYLSSSLGSNNTLIGYQASTVGGFVNHATAIGADAQVNKNNTVVLGSNIDTVEAPNLLKAKNLTVELSLHTNSILASFGQFDELRLNNTPVGDKPMCLDPQKRIGVCSGSFDSDATLRTAEATQQQSQITLQAEQIKQQQIQIEALKQAVCALNPTALFCGK